VNHLDRWPRRKKKTPTPEPDGSIVGSNWQERGGGGAVVRGVVRTAAAASGSVRRKERGRKNPLVEGGHAPEKKKKKGGGGGLTGKKEGSGCVTLPVSKTGKKTCWNKKNHDKVDWHLHEKLGVVDVLYSGRTWNLAGKSL